MKDHYDFSHAVQGKHTRPVEELKVTDLPRPRSGKGP